MSESGVTPSLAPKERAGDHFWAPIDIVGAGLAPPEPPTIGGLVYPGRRHVFSGEPESLKSWAALVLCAEEMHAGRNVVYVNMETDARETLERLRCLGFADELIRERFVYLSPDEPMMSDAVLADVRALVADRQPSLIVLDAFTGALQLHGLDPEKSIQVETFFRRVVEPLREHGAAIIILDHLTKKRETRGRFAIGSERKIGAADVHLSFEVVHPFGRGETGSASITVQKDRNGYLPRPKAAQLHLTSDTATGSVTYKVVPAHKDTSDSETSAFRPTKLMERTSRYLETRTHPVSRRDVETAVEGKAQYVRQALDVLLAEGHVRETRGARGARLVESIRPYREADDLVPTLSRNTGDDRVPTSSPSEPLNQADHATSPHLVPTSFPTPSRHLVPVVPSPYRGDDGTRTTSEYTDQTT